MRRLLRIIKWLAIALVLLIVVLLAPVAYVETACRDEPSSDAYRSVLVDPSFLRQEANTYLTYPEWHIVYAYEGLANVLKTSDEHAFGYTSSVVGFWSSFCNLSRIAGRHGGADWPTRLTIHTIGVSFTLEMAAKAAWEETIGRLFAFFRGPRKTVQDRYAAQMADDYAGFLQHTPWYKYDFDTATGQLWALPVDNISRGWERRLALGGEWKAKAAYAKVIAGAVSATTGSAQLRLRSVVTGMDAADLAGIEGVEIIQQARARTVIETPRYRAFTIIAREIAGKGGDFVEIAGNDDIMISLIASGYASDRPELDMTVIADLPRYGFDDRRLLVDIPVAKLAEFLRRIGNRTTRLEHIYDY